MRRVEDDDGDQPSTYIRFQGQILQLARRKSGCLRAPQGSVYASLCGIRFGVYTVGGRCKSARAAQHT